MQDKPREKLSEMLTDTDLKLIWALAERCKTLEEFKDALREIIEGKK